MTRRQTVKGWVSGFLTLRSERYSIFNMKSREFYFNQNKHKNFYAETFCIEPSRRKEKDLGKIYFYISFPCPQKNPKRNAVLEKVLKTAEKLTFIFEKEYYSLPERGREDSFETAIIEINKKIKEKETDFNIAIFSASPKLFVRFSKIGATQIFVIRGKEIYNLGENPSFEPNSKIFTNILQGSLEEGDKIIILNKELFETIDEENIFSSFVYINNYKGLRYFLKKRKKRLKKAVGLMLFIFAKTTKKRIFVKPNILSFALRYQSQRRKIRFILKKSCFYLLLLGVILLVGYFLL